MTARSYTASLVALSARFAGGGMTRPKIVEVLQGLMLAVPVETRDGGQRGRWQSRFDGIERMAASAVEKFGGLAQSAALIAEIAAECPTPIAELNERHFVAGVGGTVRVARVVHDDVLGRERLVFMRPADMQLRYAHRHLTGGILRAQGAWARCGSPTPNAEPTTASP